MKLALIAAVLATAAVAVGADRVAQIESADGARATIADKLEPRRAQTRARLLALHRASSVRRSIFEPDHRWQRLRARRDLVRVVARDLRELSALERELAWAASAASDLRDQKDGAPRPTLARPVSGAPVSRGFGNYRSGARLVSTRQGVELAVTSGAPVLAPASGTIVYAGPIRGLGEAVVIEASGHWITAGPLRLERPQGAGVERGDTIGRTTASSLHVQLRRIDSRGGVPLDPRPFADPPAAPAAAVGPPTP